MRQTSSLTLVLVTTFALCHGCKLFNPEPELPAITQTGANTFGCRFNGKAWIPEAAKPRDYNGILLYEFDSFRDAGYFQISAANTKKKFGIDLFSNIAGKVGTYPVGRADSSHVTWVTVRSECNYASDEDKDIYCKGSINLSRVDYKAGILSGTFAFTIYKPGCDTLKVTDGRFDLKTN